MKLVFRTLILAGIVACATQVQADGVLGHISDDTESAVAEPANPPANDRRIIYRVICDPAGEALPDCEQPVYDTETIAKPEKQQEEAMPLEAELEQMAAEPVQAKKTSKSKKTNSKKKSGSKKNTAGKTSKKSKSKKKTTKKSTSKKSSSQKK